MRRMMLAAALLVVPVVAMGQTAITIQDGTWAGSPGVTTQSFAGWSSANFVSGGTLTANEGCQPLHIDGPRTSMTLCVPKGAVVTVPKGVTVKGAAR